MIDAVCRDGIMVLEETGTCARPASVFPPTDSSAIQIPSRGFTMLVIPGRPGKDTCDGITRRDILRVGGSAMLGLTLPNILQLQKAQAKTIAGGGPGFG